MTDAQARYAAKKAALVAVKSRKRCDTIDNFGGFALIEPYTNTIVAGERFDLSADAVIAFCRELPQG